MRNIRDRQAPQKRKQNCLLFANCSFHDGKKIYYLFYADSKTLSIFAFQCQMLIFHDFADNLFKFDSLPERIFRAKLKITSGDKWTTELADQSSLRFQHRSKFYQDAIDQMINRSDLKEGYKRSEVLALDG